MSLEDYNILKLIGKGTYGEVHLVSHKKDKKQYVIKKLEFLKASAKDRKSAELEAKLLSNLRHPNIVSYKDSFQSQSGNLYIVMGFAEGGDLYTKLREQREKGEPLGEVQTVRWYIQICMALQYLHEKRILHRDLKTQNIFLTKTQIIKVGDLGIAKELESASDMATTLIGTPYYMSPELFSNRPYNHKSDVWALGCCMYEMVTLRHAFNAKDINSLMYKILKGRMPSMPDEYPTPLCDLIRDMLNQNPDKRPSVNKILRNQYVKKHIHLFLEESSKKRKTSSDKSRRSSTASNGARLASSRKTSTNSQGSSPSPHPPPSAPGPLKPSRPHRGRSRSPNVSPPIAPSPLPGGAVVENNVVSTRLGHVSEKNRAPEVVVISGSPPKNHARVPVENREKIESAPKIADSGVYVTFTEPAKVEKVEIHEKLRDLPSHAPLANVKDRVNSASSSGSASSHSSIINARTLNDTFDMLGLHGEPASSKKSQRPLPDPKPSCEPTKTESPNILGDSGESVSSVASSIAGSEAGTKKSARQRRRESKQKENMKTPAIIDEIRKSRSTGFKHRIRGDTKTKDHPNSAGDGKKSRAKDNASVDTPDSGRRKGENKGNTADIVAPKSSKAKQDEEEEFMTLLHTTLHRDSANLIMVDGDSPIFLEEADVPGRELSPLMELSEGSTSGSGQFNPGPRMTPTATPVSVHNPPVTKAPAVSSNTLRSTQRLMGRIVNLRKECIRGLGVPLLHKAYEIMDANSDDEALQESLITLLGPVRFEMWSGKIWQLKFCEESLFGHCGSITAY